MRGAHQSGPKRKYSGRLIPSRSAFGEGAEKPAVSASCPPFPAGAAVAAGGDAALRATPGLSPSLEPAARAPDGSRSPDRARCPPLRSLPHLGTRSFTHTATHKQTRSNTPHGQFLQPPAPQPVPHPPLPSDALRRSRTKLDSAGPESELSSVPGRGSFTPGARRQGWREENPVLSPRGRP